MSEICTTEDDRGIVSIEYNHRQLLTQTPSAPLTLPPEMVNRAVVGVFQPDSRRSVGSHQPVMFAVTMALTLPCSEEA